MAEPGEAFATLSPNQKAVFLAGVGHEATVAARLAYADDYENPDGNRLRTSNEVVHRVTGYISHVLRRTELPGQDQSVFDMMTEEFRAHGQEQRLWQLLRDCSN